MSWRILRTGILIGIIGGLMMGMFAMVGSAITGHGFWAPLNGIGHMVWRSAPEGGQFVLSAAILGMAVHLTVSCVVGTVIALLVTYQALDGGTLFATAIGIGATAWLIQAVVWPILDPDVHAAFNPWLLATAHVVFATGAGLSLQWLQNRGVDTTDTGPEPEPVASTPWPRTVR